MKTSRKVMVNARYRVHRITGMQRYAVEIAKRLEPYLEYCQPSAGSGIGGHLWEQVVLPARARGQVLWSPCTSGPVFAHDHVVTVHDTFPIDNPEWYSPSFASWYGWLIRRLSRRATHIIAVSEYTRDRLLALTGMSPHRLTTIYHGIGETFRPKTQEQINAVKVALKLPSRRYVLSVSSLESRKNLRCVLGAWTRVHNELPANVWLILAGPKADGKVFGQHHLPAIPPRVHFTGYVPDEHLPGLYAGAEAFLYPSLGEGFGLPMVEAFSCGTPCIAANTGSLPEVAGGAAVLVDAKDPEQLAREIARLVSSPEMRNYLRARGHARAKKFSWDSAATQTLAVFSGLRPSFGQA